MRRKLLRSQGRTEVGVALAYDRQSQRAHLRRQTVVAWFAAAFGQQARRAVVLEATQQGKPDDASRQSACRRPPHAVDLIEPEKHLKPTELLLAHRHHHHGAPPGTPNPQECRLNFAQGCHLYLYIALTTRRRKIAIMSSPVTHLRTATAGRVA